MSKDSPETNTRTEDAVASPPWLRTRWVIFYLGFFLSPLTPWNDAIVNQLPSAALAQAVSKAAGTGSYEVLYLSFYAASNVAGLLLMLVNYPELRRRWQLLVHMSRENLPKFVLAVVFDVVTFVVIYAFGSWALSWISASA